MIDDVVKANRERDLYLTNPESGNVYFIPQGWCDYWSIAQGFSGGLDYINDDGEPEPEIYCYAPICIDKNSEVETMFVPVAFLQKLYEISEAEAKKYHPALFDYLAIIDSEVC